MNKRERRLFSDSFKQQMVPLYLNGKSRADIIREYDLTPSAFNRWINQSNHQSLAILAGDFLIFLKRIHFVKGR